jgi:aryl-alcohol dehydrogenase-like predicted oxidoreductase
MLKGMPPRDTAPAHAAVAAYQKVAAAHGLSLTQMALAFVQSRPFTTSTIIGATDMTQLETVIDAFELTLGDDVLRDIAKVRREFPSVY